MSENVSLADIKYSPSDEAVEYLTTVIEIKPINGSILQVIANLPMNTRRIYDEVKYLS